MASRPSFSKDTRIIKKPLPLPKTLLLRDYLLDDMSSCSSNGFRSYPRRQCCTTVRFLVESDLNTNPKRSIVQNLKPKQLSMLQKASAAMIKTFKRLPFAGARVSTKAKLLPRCLSRKLLKHGFWKKTNKCVRNMEVKRLKSFGDLIKEAEITPPRSPSWFSTDVTTIATAELISTTNSTDSNSNSNNNRSELNDSTESFTTGNSLEANLAQNDAADGVCVTITATVTTATATNHSDTTEDTKKWRDEQSSPVSVMDFPSENDNDDEEDEVSSTSQHLNVKGTYILACKTRASKRVPQLEPVKLEDRIAQSVNESSTTENQFDFSLEDNQIEKKTTALLQLLKSNVSYHHLLKYEGVKSLLLEFFKESTLEENVSDHEMLQRAKDWMDGQEQVVFIDWECENSRQTYLRDMEKKVKWSNYDHQAEKVNVGLEVECEIFNSLVNEVLTEFDLQESDHEY